MLTHHPGDRWAIHVISCSDEHEVIVTERLANAAILKRFEHLSVALGPLNCQIPQVIQGVNPTPWRCAWLVDRQRRSGKGKFHSNPNPTWIREMGNPTQIADRSQVTGGKLLIGQLAPWVTWAWDILVILICSTSDFTTKTCRRILRNRQKENRRISPIPPSVD